MSLTPLAPTPPPADTSPRLQALRGWRGVWICSSAVVTVLCWYFVRQGLAAPPAGPTEADRYVAICTAGLGIVGAILAISFALFTHLAQSATAAFPTGFLRAIVVRLEFLGAALAMIAGLFVQLFVLMHPLNRPLAWASIVVTLYALWLLLILYGVMSQLLDLRTLAAELGVHIARKAAGAGRSPAVLSSADGRGIARILSWLRAHVPRAIARCLTGGRSERELTDALITDTHALLSASLRAITEERYEVADAALEAVGHAAETYTQVRSPYLEPEDRYHLFLHNELDMLLGHALKSPNERYVERIVHTMLRIGVATGVLPPEPILHTNSVADGWLQALRRAALCSLSLQHTDAPTRAIEGIGRITWDLMERNAVTTAVHQGAEGLGQVGVAAAKNTDAWSLYLCQPVLHNLVLAIRAALAPPARAHLISGPAFEHLMQQVRRVMFAAYERRPGVLQDLTLAAPLLGLSPPWVPSLVTVFAEALEALSHEPRGGRALAERLKTLVETVSSMSAVVARSGTSAISEYSRAYARMSYLSARVLTMDPSLSGVICPLADSLAEAAVLDYHTHLTSGGTWGGTILKATSVIPAFFVYFSRPGSSTSLLPQAEKFVRGHMTTFERAAAQVSSDALEGAMREPYGYLKLFGCWFWRWFRDTGLCRQLLAFLVRYYEASGRRELHDWEASDSIAQLGYPTDPLRAEWDVYPDWVWEDHRHSVTTALNNLDAYREYAALVERTAASPGSPAQ